MMNQDTMLLEILDDIRESLNDGVNNGVFDGGSITDDGVTTSDDLLDNTLDSGKGYMLVVMK